MSGAMIWSDKSFLGVGRSVTGRQWIDRLGDVQAMAALRQRHDLPEIVARVLAARGVAAEEAAGFLAPTLKNLMPQPSLIRDMEAGASRIADAIVAGEKTAVYGDFDVDGATSSAMLKRFAAMVGADFDIYIPDRLREGYGPNAAAFKALADDGVRLIITVDCGIAAFDPARQARADGVDLVIVDHHLAGEHLPDAVAVINPNRQDDLSGYGFLAAAGVTFVLIAAVNKALRERGRYGSGREEPDLMSLLDLAALGTVCDMVPLTGLNRALVTQGFKVMAGRGNVGLSALGDVAQLRRRPDVYAAGFVLGPRINAGGRLGYSDLGARLLTTTDRGEADAIAEQLSQLNARRQDIEQRVLADAMDQAERALGHDGALPALVVSGDDWHQGVTGLVAGRLKDRFHRPAFAIGFANSDVGTGSGRSVPGLDLGTAIRDAAERGHVVRGGGHAMAAGLTIERGKLGAFRQFLEERFAGTGAEPGTPPQLKLDGALSAGAATPDLIDLLDRAGPYGIGNPSPRFAFPAHQVVYADIAGKDHVRCTLRADDGAPLKAIAFRAIGTDLGRLLLDHQRVPLHIAGRLTIDDWGGGRRAQLFIEDAAHPPGMAP